MIPLKNGKEITTDQAIKLIEQEESLVRCNVC